MALLSGAGGASAAERFDHKGSLGLLVTGGGGYKDSFGPVFDSGARVPVTLGGSLAVGYSGNELVLNALGAFAGPHPDWGASFGYRSYFGDERVKTFVSLEAAAHVAPYFSVGPRVSLGVQYELTSTLGVLGGITADLGAGAGFRFSAEGFLGLQLRTYVLE